VGFDDPDVFESLFRDFVEKELKEVMWAEGYQPSSETPTYGSGSAGKTPISHPMPQSELLTNR